MAKPPLIPSESVVTWRMYLILMLYACVLIAGDRGDPVSLADAIALGVGMALVMLIAYRGLYRPMRSSITMIAMASALVGAALMGSHPAILGGVLLALLAASLVMVMRALYGPLTPIVQQWLFRRGWTPLYTAYPFPSVFLVTWVQALRDQLRAVDRANPGTLGDEADRLQRRLEVAVLEKPVRLVSTMQQAERFLRVHATAQRAAITQG